MYATVGAGTAPWRPILHLGPAEIGKHRPNTNVFFLQIFRKSSDRRLSGRSRAGFFGDLGKFPLEGSQPAFRWAMALCKLSSLPGWQLRREAREFQ